MTVPPRAPASATRRAKHAVWRYPVEIVDVQTIHMPQGALTLTVARREGAKTATRGGTVHDAVEMWALVDTSAPLAARRFRVVGTGHPVNLDTEVLEFLGTVQIEQGSLIFHVFEIVGGS